MTTRRNAITSVRFIGATTGEGWWPQHAQIAKPLSMTIVRSHDLPTLRDMAESVLAAEDGDYSTAARFTADSFITIRRQHHYGRATITRERVLEMVDVPSLTGLVTESWYASDFLGDDW